MQHDLMIILFAKIDISEIVRQRHNDIFQSSSV